MANSGGERRWGTLDLLRAVAVLLVVGAHFENAEPQGTWFWYVIGATNRVGWAGVDLFLALSGFLISNLLFREFRESGAIDWKRFLTRRAFKIYPGFYLLVMQSLVGVIKPQCELNSASVVGEFLFVQNYLGLLWGHTWSLALEEHFYLAITVLLALRWRAEVVRRWPVIVGTVALCCLTSRAIIGLCAPFSFDTHIQQTHVRVDGLFFGSLAGWLFNFRSEAIGDFILQRRGVWNLATAAMILGSLLPRIHQSYLAQTIGLTLLSIGFSMLTLGAVCGAWPRLRRNLGEMVEEIGRCSYGIYLWHLAVLLRWLPWMKASMDLKMPLVMRFALYVLAAICMGIFMTRLVEMPFLKLREKLVPAREIHAVGRGVAALARGWDVRWVI